MRDFPKRAWLFTTAVAFAAAVSVLWLLPGGVVPHLGVTIGFGVLFLLAELVPVTVASGSTYSVSYVIAVAAMVSLGPANAAIAASFGALDLQIRRRPDWFGRMVFNGSQLTLVTALAGFAYRATGGAIGGVGARDFPYVLVPLFAASVVYFLANTGLVASMIALVRRLSFQEAWSANFLSILPGTFAFAVLGVLFAVLFGVIGLAGVLLIFVPMLVARSALKAATKMDEAYEDTLRTLVRAIEAKDAYTSGHAERVSKIAAMVARELGLPERRVRALRIAALLHDVGKLGVSTTVLKKPGKLTPEEYEHMKAHPLHGCEIVGEIDFLREGDAVEAVRHHHERLDGKGYPDALQGDEIPLVARIVTVSDAFDSMTSTRTYRQCKSIEEAFTELRRCIGMMFDERVVDALARAVARNGWEPTPELYSGEQTPRPEVSVHA